MAQEQQQTLPPQHQDRQPGLRSEMNPKPLVPMKRAGQPQRSRPPMFSWLPMMHLT